MDTEVTIEAPMEIPIENLVKNCIFTENFILDLDITNLIICRIIYFMDQVMQERKIMGHVTYVIKLVILLEVVF